MNTFEVVESQFWIKFLARNGSPEEALFGDRSGTPFWNQFWSHTVPKWDPKPVPEGAPDGPETDPQNSDPKMDPKRSRNGPPKGTQNGSIDHPKFKTFYFYFFFAQGTAPVGHIKYGMNCFLNQIDTAPLVSDLNREGFRDSNNDVLELGEFRNLRLDGDEDEQGEVLQGDQGDKSAVEEERTRDD